MPESRLFVYRLRHARAAKLASTLQAIFGSTAAQGPPPSSIPPTRTSDRPAALGSDSAKPASMQPSTATVSISATLHAPIQIVSDETTNALVIHAIEPDYEIVRQAIEALDLRPRQVLIEMLIAEVRHSSELDFGVAARSTRETGPDGARGSAIASSSTADLILRLTTNAAFDVNVALHALQSRGDVRILSRPVLLAQNNQEAKILVGSQRPFVQVFRSLPTEAAIRDQVVQYKDVGTSLTILPTSTPTATSISNSRRKSARRPRKCNSVRPSSARAKRRPISSYGTDRRRCSAGWSIEHRKRLHSVLPFLAAIPLAGHLFGSAFASRANDRAVSVLDAYIIENRFGRRQASRRSRASVAVGARREDADDPTTGQTTVAVNNLGTVARVYPMCSRLPISNTPACCPSACKTIGWFSPPGERRSTSRHSMTSEFSSTPKSRSSDTMSRDPRGDQATVCLGRDGARRHRCRSRLLWQVKTASPRDRRLGGARERGAGDQAGKSVARRSPGRPRVRRSSRIAGRRARGSLSNRRHATWRARRRRVTSARRS
jgi:hypothetical protein